MPNCVVRGCTNQSSRNKKQDGITFHTFPIRNQNIKEKWIAVLRDSRKETLWQPTTSSVVCSTHFKSEDFYKTPKGLRRIKKNAYPKILPGISERSNDQDRSRPPSVVQIVAVPDITFSDIKEPSSPSAILPDIPVRLNDKDQSEPPTVIFPGVSVQIKEEDLSEPATVNFPDILVKIKEEDLSEETTVDKSAAIPELSLSDSTSLNQTPAPCVDTAFQPAQAPLIAVQPAQAPLIAVQPEQAPLIAVQPAQAPLIIHSPTKSKLLKRVLSLERKLSNNRKKIKTLHQKVRRLETRNKSLKEVLDIILKTKVP